MDFFQINAILFSNDAGLTTQVKNFLYHNGFTCIYATDDYAQLKDYVQNESEILLIYDATYGYPAASDLEFLFRQKYGVYGLLFFRGGGYSLSYTCPEEIQPKFPIVSIPYPFQEDELRETLLKMLVTDDIPSFILKRKISAVVSKLLQELGIPKHLIGYYYLHTAVSLVAFYPEYLRKLNQNLYPYIAQKNHTTTFCVERAIRNALEYARKTSDNPILWSSSTKTKPCSIVNFLSSSTSLIREGRISTENEDTQPDLPDIPSNDADPSLFTEPPLLNEDSETNVKP